jgi:hypothetical protein
MYVLQIRHPIRDFGTWKGPSTASLAILSGSCTRIRGLRCLVHSSSLLLHAAEASPSGSPRG